MNPVQTSAWQALARHAALLRDQHLRTLFAEDADRFAHFSISHGELLLDFSKQRVTAETLTLLHRLAQELDVAGWRERMLAGEAINHSENRAVLHMALRADRTAVLPAQGENVVAAVHTVLDRMELFCQRIHQGEWRGFSGQRITDVVNIGIGGSDLGPRMAVRALAAWQQPDLRVHFVANADGADLATTLTRLDPRTTLFIVASKTFTTLETMLNAHSARAWILAAANDEAALPRHFVAVSTNLEATRVFGIDKDNVFPFWDWVGGRFSLCSAIGLSVALAVGFQNFMQLLAGARAMDQHFITAEPERNLPLTLALLAVWNTCFLDAHSQGIMPYSQSLEFFPAYLQQLEMESCGKRTDREGQPVSYATSPVVWGTAGTNGQHSFFQLLHQGSALVPCDFIASRRADQPLPGHQDALLANCLAQSAALAFGQTEEEAQSAGIARELLPYRTFPGNQPSTTLLLPSLTPFTLGQLIALYEHKVFCLGALWNLNAFDQWGVELGKQLAGKLTPAVRSPEHAGSEFDSSTRGLLRALHGTA
ncbi:MAG TPA: glucose-6-phosphate isomerase [Rhodocyclaceae bacterium]|nr:glucose-6-phosphate isomerase [Rhodocyclaceae bacterium]